MTWYHEDMTAYRGHRVLFSVYFLAASVFMLFAVHTNNTQAQQKKQTFQPMKDTLARECQDIERKEKTACAKHKNPQVRAECLKNAEREAVEKFVFTRPDNGARRGEMNKGCSRETLVKEKFGEKCVACKKGISVIDRDVSQDMNRAPCHNDLKFRVFCRDEELDKKKKPACDGSEFDLNCTAANTPEALEKREDSLKKTEELFKKMQEADEARKLKANDGDNGTVQNLGYRLNNPGSLRCGSNAVEYGATNCPRGSTEFARFPTLEDGLAAKIEVFQQYPERPAYKALYPDGMTVQNFLDRYAPAFENDHAKYLRGLEQYGGYTAHTKLDMSNPDFLGKFALSVMRVESGVFSRKITPDMVSRSIRRVLSQ
jgi:hypothetical protein